MSKTAFSDGLLTSRRKRLSDRPNLGVRTKTKRRFYRTALKQIGLGSFIFELQHG
jgi:hypothetical protein